MFFPCRLSCSVCTQMQWNRFFSYPMVSLIQTVASSSLLLLLMSQAEAPAASTILPLDKDQIRCMLWGCASQVLNQKFAQTVSTLLLMSWWRHVLIRQKVSSGSRRRLFAWYATPTVSFFEHSRWNQVIRCTIQRLSKLTWQSLIIHGRLWCFVWSLKLPHLLTLCTMVPAYRK